MFPFDDVIMLIPFIENEYQRCRWRIENANSLKWAHHITPHVFRSQAAYMGWGTSADNYGAFLREGTTLWPRAYINKLPETERNKKINMIKTSGPTSYDEYGTFYSGLTPHRRPLHKPRNDLYTYKVTERSLNKFNDKVLGIDTKNPRPGPLIPVRPDLVKLGALQRRAKTDSKALRAIESKPDQRATAKTAGSVSKPTSLYGKQGQVALPDIEHVDVRFLTKDNDIIAIDPDCNNLGSVTYPRGVKNLKLPDIREMNISFDMRDGTRFSVRSVPKSGELMDKTEAGKIKDMKETPIASKEKAVTHAIALKEKAPNGKE